MAGEINFGLIDPNTPERVAGSFQQGQANALAMQNAQMTGAANVLAMKKAQQEIASENALTKVYQEAGGDTQKAIEGLKAAGQYKPAMELQKGLSEQEKLGLEVQKTKLEGAVKHMEYVSQRLSGVTDNSGQLAAKADIAKILGDHAAANIPDTYDPAYNERIIKQGMAIKDQLSEHHKTIEEQLNERKFGYQQQQDIRQLSQAERHFQASQGIRQQELALKKGELGAKQKDIQQAQLKQVIGAKNTADAIAEYKDKLASFKTSDLVNPDARAEMGTAYNNMLMQAKEAYALGALTGPDMDTLQSIITDPASLKGAITSKAALKKQADALTKIMENVSKTARGDTEINQRGNAGASQEPDLDALLKMYGGK